MGRCRLSLRSLPRSHTAANVGAPSRRQVERAPVGVCQRPRGHCPCQARAEAQVKQTRLALGCTARQLHTGPHADRKGHAWRCTLAGLQAGGMPYPGSSSAASSSAAPAGGRQLWRQRTLPQVPAARRRGGGPAAATGGQQRVWQQRHWSGGALCTRGGPIHQGQVHAGSWIGETGPGRV